VRASDHVTAEVLESVALWAAVLPISPDEVVVRDAPAWMRSLWARDVRAMTIGSTIYVDPDFVNGATPNAMSRLMVHELIHARQWRMLGPVRFVFGYLQDYLSGRLAGRSHDEAYRAIEHEVEARETARSIMP